ncbi:hypothetical protein SAMN02745218_02791 [Desulfofundulus australicus DSM 11792]|uniref:Cysteine-rich VLP domain-containing protein n=1 Tax=Desulfofundulus australicus DSM 11792 TaxID=1121425 RepID=A0A1M5DDK4_9FIRM|nr:cysteine-rich VLP protein [Desulfofundulus australicus]SHF64924.1 hypothetical protein SAMN02745218_02791 [Desulfofundulus australicus DSM 11792]
MELPAEILAKVRSLVKKECANHDAELNGIRHYCCREPAASDKRCLYFVLDDVRCKWFEEAVLPLDSKLEYEYWQVVNPYKVNKPRDLSKQCKMCGKVFSAKSNREVYCDSCKVTARREAVRKCNQRYREKKRERGIA